jgi:hypothetical protein
VKKFMFSALATILLIGAVGLAGATSFNLSDNWSIFSGLKFGSEPTKPVTPMASTFDLFAMKTPGSVDVFGRAAGWESGAISGGFPVDIPFSYGGIISSERNDRLILQRILRRNYPRNGEPATPVPEPATILMVGIGMIGIAHAARKKIKR